MNFGTQKKKKKKKKELWFVLKSMLFKNKFK
jgi:hypothetical protein